MKAFLRLGGILAIVALAVAGCTPDMDSPLPQQVDKRGNVTYLAHKAHYTLAQVDSLMVTINPFLPQVMPPRYGVDLYTVTYETPSYDRRMTIASGVICLPSSDSLPALPLVSYQHGTVLDRIGVATHGYGEWQLGVILASDGYASAQSDYLGLGWGPGFHPYVHAKSEATAVIDMIRACRNVMAKKDLAWNGQLFLFGYSQGGHATMAAHRELQTYHADEFTVTASAPMAGPYDASGVQEDVIVGFEPYPTPGYLPFIVYSYNMVYDIVADEAILFKSPYDTLIPPYMDQLHSVGELNEICNPVPRYMIKDSVMAAYEADDNHPLKLALRDNDLWNWVPQTHMRLFYCTGDDQVSYENSIVAYNKFMEAGGSPNLIKLVDVNPDLNHSDCALPTMLLGKVFFDSLRVE